MLGNLLYSEHPARGEGYCNPGYRSRVAEEPHKCYAKYSIVVEDELTADKLMQRRYTSTRM